jgi:hypothetical protein
MFPEFSSLQVSNQNYVHFLIFPMRANYPIQLINIDLIALIIFAEDYNSFSCPCAFF